MIDLNSLPELITETYKPLYAQLTDMITEYIRNEKLKEGDLIPSENQLLARYQISRNTIRQAIQQLEVEGWVKRIRGKGTFVTKPKEAKSLDFCEDIESKIADLGKKPDNLLCDFREVGVTDRWSGFLSLPEGSPVLYFRRVKLADGEPLALEERYLVPEAAKLFSTEDLKNTTSVRLLETREETMIHYVDYLLGNSPLSETEAKELCVEPTTPIFRRSSIYYTTRMKPIMAGRVTFLAEKVEWRIQLYKSGETWEALTIVS